MHTVSEFRVGKLYTNDQIRFTLSLENLGGIRPAVDEKRNLRHLAVITTAESARRRASENPYQDRIEGDVLLYTAEGREGDQRLTGKNKRLIEQYHAPTPFYGFMNMGRQTYRFLGLLELLRHYQEAQADSLGSLRKVWLFEFRIHEEPPVVPVDLAPEISATIISQSRQQNPLSELEREVLDLDTEEQPELEASNVQSEVLRSQLLRIHPHRFEHLIGDLMLKNGFVDVSVTSASGDGGIDLNAHVDESNDFFAGTHVQVQVKRWRHAVGSAEINKFRGALSTTAKGIFVTTSHYTRAALVEARHEFKPAITVINGNKLSSLIKGSKIDVTEFL